ncbi:MAG: S8 family serine peptidase [Gammaproteobacteria bacterium]|nr:S8 family serine peptidase [Gammaproteobacteria bacterium]
MKNLAISLTVVSVLTFLAAYLAWSQWPTREAGDRADDSTAVLERTARRTLRESRTWVANRVAPAEIVDDVAGRPIPPPAAPSGLGAGIDGPPEGYSSGDYRGAMQRSPRTTSSERELAPNPYWIESRPETVIDTLLGQAARFDRDFTFAVLRIAPGTDTQALNRSLLPLNAEIVGNSGPYVRVSVPAERRRLKAIAELPGVLGVGAVPPQRKAEEAFVREVLSRPAGETIPVFVSLMTTDPAGEWRDALAGFGVVVGAYDADLHSYTANMPPTVLERLLSADFVLSVEPVPVVQSNHATAVPIMGVDGLRSYNAARRDFSGITGAGIAVGVLDTGLNISHMDIAHGRDSVCGENFVPDEDWDLWLDLGHHGTHVFGTIAGAGRTNPLLAGMAPELSHLRFGKVLSANGFGSGDDIRRGIDYLARPSSCSWRGEIPEAVKPLIVNMSLAATSLTFSGRGVGERKLDSVVHAYSQLYVVAQANSGLHGFSNYGTAKNSLSVGAISDSGILASFSSHGPTADGRLAPNVVATGVRLTSPRGGGSASAHNTFSGTSMAAPSVAGVAALLMQARPEFREQSALARARLMASAVRPDAFLDSDSQFPSDNSGGPGRFNNLYGLGLVSGRTSLYSRDNPEGWRIGSAISRPDNESYEHVDIEVPPGAGRLDVVLTWDEQPADTLTRSVLNDLDLWVDRGANCGSGACGEYASRSEVDNVEWLMIEDPAPGTYRIKVVPVEIYGEHSTAAVAWKIVRGDVTPELELTVEDVSGDETSEYATVEVTVNASGYVASGTTLHMGCRNVDGNCWELWQAYLPHLNRVYREDGLDRPETGSGFETISMGEIAPDAPRRVQLAFLRDEIPAGTALQVTASSWNGKAASRNITLSEDEDEPFGELGIPANDDFSHFERIEGVAGEISLDLAPASREPGEPMIAADSRTLWYGWEAPAKGLFRFKLEDADSGEAHEAEFALFTGGELVDLELAAEKQGGEISFAARAGVDYRLRLSSGDWDAPPLVLKWESAAARPVNDDFNDALKLKGESGEVDFSNEGATLEGSEFFGGASATVWFDWTAPADGPWIFRSRDWMLTVHVFEGAQADDLRLLSNPGVSSRAIIVAEQDKTYRIVVASRSAGDSGQRSTLSWNPIPASNTGWRFEKADHFSDAISFEGSQGIISAPGQEHSGLTVEPGEPMSTGIGTAWLQWTAPATGRFSWLLDGSYRLRFSVFTGDSLPNLQLVGSSRGGSKIALDAVENVSYRIAAGQSEASVQHSSPDEFTVHWGPTPANDDRAAASRISGVAGAAAAGLTHATSSPQDPVDTVGTDSVWYRWRAPRSGWHRFQVKEHPLSVILSVYPGDGDGQAVADSERSFIANGRVEAHVLARAGESYDIRVSARPGVEKAADATLEWGPSNAPPFLSYKGATETDSLFLGLEPQAARSPANLAVSGDGRYLFSTAQNGIFAFERDAGANALPLVWRTEPDAAEGFERDALEGAGLWWNSRHGRLMALTRSGDYSLTVPEDGSPWLSLSRIAAEPGSRDVAWNNSYRGAGSDDGRYFYAVGLEWLQVYRVDSADRFALVQEVSSGNASSEVDSLIVDDLGDPPFHLAFSRDNSHLYLAAETGLFVFRRDSDTGKLGLEREILFSDNLPGAPFKGLGGIERAALDNGGGILFVSGPQSIFPTGSPFDNPFFDAAIVAFDVETDPAAPRRLDALTRVHAERSVEVAASWSHLKPSYYYERLRNCHWMYPHADLPAVDVFCENGWYVAHWDRDTETLEVADFAVAGERDRFGATLPETLGAHWSWEYRQMAQSPDGGRVYRTTNAGQDGAFDAIHVFERASAAGFQPDASRLPAVDSPPGQNSARTDGAFSGARFAGYASGERGFSERTVFAPGDEFNVYGSVFVDPLDRGKPGALHIAAVMPDGGIFVKNAAGDWLPWDGGALPAVHVWERLPRDFDVLVFGTASVPSTATLEDSAAITGEQLGVRNEAIRFYIAYSTGDNGGVYHYSTEPVALTISGDSARITPN